MGIVRDIKKIVFKSIDRVCNTTFYPDLMIKSSRSISFMRSDYKISKDNLYIYIHVPKTAGTTFHYIAQKINMVKKEKIYLSSHNPLSIYHSPEDTNYVTTIRDPVERAYSYYNMNYYHKKALYHYLAKKSLEHFMKYCPETQNIFCKFYSGYINENVNDNIYQIASKNSKKFMRIFNFDNIEKELNNFCNQIDFPIDKIPQINAYNKLFNVDNKKINRINREVIEFYNYYDLKLYSDLNKILNKVNSKNINPFTNIN